MHKNGSILSPYDKPSQLGINTASDLKKKDIMIVVRKKIPTTKNIFFITYNEYENKLINIHHENNISFILEECLSKI